MTDTTVILFNYISAGSQQVSSKRCQELIQKGPDICHSLGYGPCGITKGSRAAQAMSMEARQQGGGVLPMRCGGITAALQSIGDSGVVKPEAMKSIHDGMVRGGLKRSPGY